MRGSGTYSSRVQGEAPVGVLVQIEAERLRITHIAPFMQSVKRGCRVSERREKLLLSGVLCRGVVRIFFGV